MGFFCYTCCKKVRGRPVNHGCTRRKFGKNANTQIYRGGHSHRGHPQTPCFSLRDNGECRRQNCAYKHYQVQEAYINGIMCREWLRTGRCRNFKICCDCHCEDMKGSQGIDLQTPCISLRDEGECSRGQSCTYKQHYYQVKEAYINGIICREWMRTGTCRNFETCCDCHREDMKGGFQRSDRQTPCISLRDNGECRRQNCVYKHYQAQEAYSKSIICREWLLAGRCRNFEIYCGCHREDMKGTQVDPGEPFPA